MSVGFHVNMSTCSLRKLMSMSSYFGPDPSSLKLVTRDEDHFLHLLGLGWC